jgi:hypothetical protein
MTDQELKRKRSLAAYKANRTRKMNALLEKYNSETSTGKKAAIKRQMNILERTPFPA